MSQTVAYLEPVASRIAAGEYAVHIAAELGMSPQLLSYHLRKLPNWPEIVESAHEARLDNGELEHKQAISEGRRALDQGNVENARARFDLARVQEGRLKRLEWRAEREAPHRWGIKQQVQVNHRVGVDERLTASLDRLIGRVVEGQHSLVSEEDDASTGVMSSNQQLTSVAPKQQIETLQALVDE